MTYEPPSFGLNLGPSCDLCLVATGCTSVWLTEFARIAGLEPCTEKGLPKALFVSRQDLSKSCLGERDLVIPLGNETFSVPEWKREDWLSLTIWSHVQSNDMIVALSGPNDAQMGHVTRWQFLLYLFSQKVDHGALHLHAGLAVRDGVGYLLAGKSGVGKSTCSGRLPHPWRSLSDDQSLVRSKNVGSDKRYFVHPVPTWGRYFYHDSEEIWEVEQSFQLGTIFFLDKAVTNELISLGKGEAAVRIYQSATTMAEAYMQHLSRNEQHCLGSRMIQNACELSTAVPAFVLRTSLTGHFWDEMDRAIRVISSVA
jgi:SynChlorMet cassette protein ScmC